jgi:hypothetical protein
MSQRAEGRRWIVELKTKIAVEAAAITGHEPN